MSECVLKMDVGFFAVTIMFVNVCVVNSILLRLIKSVYVNYIQWL